MTNEEQMEEQRAEFHRKAEEFRAAAQQARALGKTHLADHLDTLAKTFADT